VVGPVSASSEAAPTLAVAGGLTPRVPHPIAGDTAWGDRQRAFVSKSTPIPRIGTPDSTTAPVFWSDDVTAFVARCSACVVNHRCDQ